jgi:hypothetical protein
MPATAAAAALDQYAPLIPPPTTHPPPKGPAWTAVLLAGGLISLAKLVRHTSTTAPDAAPYHAALCAAALASLLLVGAARSSRQPRTQLLGTLTAVVCGLLFLLGQHTPAAVFWAADAGGMLASIGVAAGVAVAVSAGVVPTLANDEVGGAGGAELVCFRGCKWL